MHVLNTHIYYSMPKNKLCSSVPGFTIGINMYPINTLWRNVWIFLGAPMYRVSKWCMIEPCTGSVHDWLCVVQLIYCVFSVLTEYGFCGPCLQNPTTGQVMLLCMEDWGKSNALFLSLNMIIISIFIQCYLFWYILKNVAVDKNSVQCRSCNNK